MGDDILVELKRINDYLALLSLRSFSEMIDILKGVGILNTKKRVAMFLLIDGNRTTLEIAKKVGISERGAQLFIKELTDRQIIVIEKKGNAFVPVKNYEKIVEIIQIHEGGEEGSE